MAGDAALPRSRIVQGVNFETSVLPPHPYRCPIDRHGVASGILGYFLIALARRKCYVLFMKPTLQAIFDSAFLSQRPERPYHCEASVQMKLGIELWRQLGVEPELEVCHRPTGEYLDLLLTVGDIRYGIELKYKTKPHPGFDYTNQMAQDNGRYDFLKDVSRIECFVSSGFIHAGFSCLLTNDHYYWRSLKDTSLAKTFQLTDGAILSGIYTPTWKDRKKPLNIQGPYVVQWQDSSNPSPANAPFRALLIEQVPARFQSLPSGGDM